MSGPGDGAAADGVGAGPAGGGRVRPADLYVSPNALAADYSMFRVSERLLLTGHSHQAWPDVGFEGQKRAWLDASELVDSKWDRAFERRDRVARGYAALLDDAEGHVTLGSNTHELVVRFLSALPLAERPRIVTTEGEFHSIRRQVDRLAEEGWIEVAKVPAYPAADLAERLSAAVDDRTACALVSGVLFERAHVVPGLDRLAEACARHGAELLVDAYHALGAVPFRLGELGLQGAYVVGGGYKYLQLGEGNCFLRSPSDGVLRPVITGWFSEFAELADARTPGELRYGRGAARFAGSTYDPTAHYRAAEVMDLFERRGLTPELLREVSLHQIGVLEGGLRALAPDPAVLRLDDSVPAERRGGFLAVDAPDAAGLQAALAERGVRTDHRGRILRLGPAPYLSDAQLEEAVDAVGEVLIAFRRRARP